MSDDARSPRFATTHWSLIRAAGADDAPATRAALAALCQTYWYPLYAYARRRGADAHTAEDQVQGFFAVVLEKAYLGTADRDRGRFRTFLLVAFRRHIGKLADHAATQKRGGDRDILALDFGHGEERYRREPSHVETAERIFERRWALTVLERTLDALREEARSAGREERFRALRPYLQGGAAAPSHAETAEALGLSVGSVKVAVHRLRARYRDRLRAEIRQTVDDPDTVDAEIQHLIAALGSG